MTIDDDEINSEIEIIFRLFMIMFTYFLTIYIGLKLEYIYIFTLCIILQLQRYYI